MFKVGQLVWISTHLAAAQDKSHIYILLLIIPATYSSGVAQLLSSNSPCSTNRMISSYAQDTLEESGKQQLSGSQKTKKWVLEKRNRRGNPELALDF